MSGNLHPIWTKETLVSGFETLPPPVAGELNLRELLRIREHCQNNAQKTKTDCDAQNFLYLVTPPTFWSYFSTILQPADPQDSGDDPSYIEGEIQTHNTTIRDVWQLERKNMTNSNT